MPGTPTLAGGTKEPDAAIDAQNPNERLCVEPKSWLDLADDAYRGTLAKGPIALANHRRGVAIVGFDADGKPVQDRPDNLAPYSQDAVNDRQPPSGSR